ncbi:MAG: head-tail adaptor protein [Rhodobacteraceae bacterium]|nr:head-tail adaptor protein [Paracoccaceae bacterium]
MILPRLNRLLALEAAVRTPDGAGGFTEVWTELGQLWGEITPRTGRERAEAGIPISSVGVRIVVRGAPVGAPSRPKPEQRFREGTRVFVIQAVTEADLEAHYLTCFAVEEVVA